MNSVVWVAQILLAGSFLFAGFSKIFVFKRQKAVARTPLEAGCVGMPDGLAAAIAILEIAGALGLLIPVDPWQPYVLVRLCAGGLALLAGIVAIYQARRHEHTTPTVTMLVLALFVIIGRWPA